MNIRNNKRRQATREKIESIFIQFLENKDISKITVSEIIKKAEINRSTFYANYIDIYDLADKIRDRLEDEVQELYENDTFNNCGNDYLKLFRHIRDNQQIYITYFKLGYDNKQVIDLSDIKKNEYFPDNYIEYHIEFHKAGLNAIIKKWLTGGCKESPEDMVKIIEDEYKGRKLL